MLQPSSAHFRGTVIIKISVAITVAAIMAISAGPPLGTFTEVMSGPG